MILFYVSVTYSWYRKNVDLQKCRTLRSLISSYSLYILSQLNRIYHGLRIHQSIRLSLKADWLLWRECKCSHVWIKAPAKALWEIYRLLFFLSSLHFSVSQSYYICYLHYQQLLKQTHRNGIYHALSSLQELNSVQYFFFFFFQGLCHSAINITPSKLTDM